MTLLTFGLFCGFIVGFIILCGFAATEGEPGGWPMLFISCIVLGLFIFCSPSFEVMKENSLRHVLQDKPSCITRPDGKDDLDCLKEYSSWLIDSAAAEVELSKYQHTRDSLREASCILRGESTRLDSCMAGK